MSATDAPTSLARPTMGDREDEQRRRAAYGETVGQRIRRLRRERGLSQREIAEPGVSYAYISRIEAGTRTPSMKALRKLAAKLGVSAEYLETGLEPVVVVVRHPDAENDVSLWPSGFTASVVSVDLGASFDGYPTDRETAVDWAAGVFTQLEGLPDAHPACGFVVETVEETIRYVFEDDVDEIVAEARVAATRP